MGARIVGVRMTEDLSRRQAHEACRTASKAAEVVLAQGCPSAFCLVGVIRPLICIERKARSVQRCIEDLSPTPEYQ
jgi:hypothetical protein